MRTENIANEKRYQDWRTQQHYLFLPENRFPQQDEQFSLMNGYSVCSKAYFHHGDFHLNGSENELIDQNGKKFEYRQSSCDLHCKWLEECKNMEKKDFPKGTKPREIFVYTCERIAEPLIPLGYKYRKSKNDIYKKDGIFVFSFYFSPSIRFGSTTFTAFFDVSSPVIAQWRSEQEGTEDTYDGIVGTSIARLTRRYDDFPRYEVSTLLERERSIQEISGQIQDYALPFFARFSDLPKLLDDVEREGFFPHRKGFDVPKRNREFIECFREYLQKQQANGLSY